jgi:hypothetical protein
MRLERLGRGIGRKKSGRMRREIETKNGKSEPGEGFSSRLRL